jgi:hypothetical protein
VVEQKAVAVTRFRIRQSGVRRKSNVSLVILEAKQHGVGSGLGGLENEGKSKMPRHKGVGSGEVAATTSVPGPKQQV